MRHRSLRQTFGQLVETLAAEPPARSWYLWVTPIVVSTGLVALALLFSLVQVLLDA
jgi:hypothetical protein